MFNSFAEAAVAASQHHMTLAAEELASEVWRAWLQKYGAPMSRLRIEGFEAQSLRAASPISRGLPCLRLQSLTVNNGRVIFAPQQDAGPDPSKGVLAAVRNLTHLELHGCLVAGWEATLPQLTNLQHLAVLPLPGTSSSLQQHLAADSAAVETGNSLTTMIPGSV
jgi:hypothetical protein